MLGKEAKLEQGRLPSEETLGIVVYLSHSFNDLLLSMTRENDEIILVFDTYTMCL